MAQPNFLSHLKAERLGKELVVSQMRVKEYEDLFATLYRNACEHCKASFQRIAGTNGAGTVSEAGLAPGAGAALRSTFSPYASSPSRKSTQPVVQRTSNRKSLPGSSTDGHGATLSRILKPPRSGYPTYQHGPATRASSGPEPGSPKGGAFRHGVSTWLSDQIVLNSPEDKPTQAQYFVKFPDDKTSKPTLRLGVNLEHVWTHETGGLTVKFSPNGKYLAVGLSNNGLDSQETYIYDLTIGKKICLLADRYAVRQYSSANYLSFSPADGRYLATGHSTGLTMIWQVGKKDVRNAFGAHPVHCVDFSPNGRFVVSGSLYNSGVRIWSMRDGSSISLPDHDRGASATVAVRFSPNGKHVLASDLQGMVRIWNVRTTKLVRKWKAHRGAARGAAFTQNGRGLVTAGHDHPLKYWDLGTLGFDNSKETEVLKFVGHTEAVRSVAISRDGRWVVSGSDDCTVRIWDLEASLQCTLVGHEKEVTSVDFSSTGNYVACGSWDGKVSVWKYESPRD